VTAYGPAGLYRGFTFRLGLLTKPFGGLSSRIVSFDFTREDQVVGRKGRGSKTTAAARDRASVERL